MKTFLDSTEMLITDSYIKTPDLVIAIQQIAAIRIAKVFMPWRYLWVLPAVGSLLLSVLMLGNQFGWCLLALTLLLSLFTNHHVSKMEPKYSLILSLSNGESYLFHTRPTKPGVKVTISMHNQHVNDVYEALVKAIVD